ncbi:MAG: DUF3536 domain-containing protein, partial [Ignavibacteria bacterium]
MINLCIHGHFYQPPRENPWTGEIEKQDSSKPYHDWNEKIYEECYRPNSQADIFEENGNIIKGINNYELISFNFGPTLIAWIKNKHPETYKRIIEADRKSIISHDGHGNAIAMCYNHMIMPLANLRDKITQVKWGLKDFKHHFKRDAESIWLPETACNYETLEVLIEEGIKYIILDVSQAEKAREFGSDEWLDVSSGTINPLNPFRCFSEINPEKYIDIFFYDSPLSKSISFEDLLMSADNLMQRILLLLPENNTEERLISIATDGETFGHHKKNTDKTLAIFLSKLVPENGIKIVNYGEYLEKHTPKYEVKIKHGDNGEGTSWSCPHGVKRWKQDCGCGSGAGWHQQWRKPLRESLDWLIDELIKIYEVEGSRYLNDIWKARNEYIEIILDSSPEAAINYFANNAKR